MSTRTSKHHSKIAPPAYQALLQLREYLHHSSLDLRLVYLVDVRASQINGCAYCIDLHMKEALQVGETQRRLNLLSTWREVPIFTRRERAALAWTEALTTIAPGGVPDAVYQEARQQFSEQELTDLTYTVASINAWNRIGVGLLPALPNLEPVE